MRLDKAVVVKGAVDGGAGVLGRRRRCLVRVQRSAGCGQRLRHRHSLNLQWHRGG